MQNTERHKAKVIAASDAFLGYSKLSSLSVALVVGSCFDPSASPYTPVTDLGSAAIIGAAVISTTVSISKSNDLPLSVADFADFSMLEEQNYPLVGLSRSWVDDGIGRDEESSEALVFTSNPEEFLYRDRRQV